MTPIISFLAKGDSFFNVPKDRHEFFSYLRQKLIGFARAVAGMGQRHKRQRTHFHDLAKLGQFVHGLAFLVALHRPHIGVAGHVGDGATATIVLNYLTHVLERQAQVNPSLSSKSLTLPAIIVLIRMTHPPCRCGQWTGGNGMVISRAAFFVCCMLALVTSGLLHAQQIGTVTYVYTDPQGTPLAEADAKGNIIATYDYTPYGTTALGTPPNGPGYTGHVDDPETNLVYMQHRYYDPATGRFLSVDPVTPTVANTFNFNRYDYVNNNPINHTDPDGRCIWDGCIAEIALAGALVGGGIDIGVQKYFHPNQPINKTEVAISAVSGAITGGSGAALTGAAAAGTITATQAVLRQAAVSGAVGFASSAAGDVANGKKPSGQAALNAAGANIVGSVLGSSISAAAGDFAGAAANGAMNDMSKAAVNTAPGIGTTIADTTRAVGSTASKPGILQATASQFSRVGDVAGAAGTEKLNEKQN